LIKIFRPHVPTLAAGLFLAACCVAAADQTEVTAGDILNFCEAPSPDDAAKKAEALGWHRAADQDVAALRPLVDPLEDQPKNIQAWQRDRTVESGILLYAYDTRPGDGSFMSMLKSVIPRPRNCLYVGANDATTLKMAMTAHLGVAPTENTSAAAPGKTSTWETHSATASLSEISHEQSRSMIAVSIIYK
jgi:hypothetical protein